MGLDRGPAWRRDLQCARVVEGIDAGIKLRIGPNLFEFY